MYYIGRGVVVGYSNLAGFTFGGDCCVLYRPFAQSAGSKSGSTFVH